MSMESHSSSSCSTPISWLRLEQHALGELPTARATEVDRHLADCASCREAFESIAIQNTERELPPLAAPVVISISRPKQSSRTAAAALAALALAAALFFVLRKKSPPPDDLSGDRWKGGDVSFTLVRDDEAMFSEGTAKYRDGDRFKALVTCPPSDHGTFDLAIYDEQQQRATFPFDKPAALDCGNAVALPGAFRTTGHDGTMTVCLVWSDGNRPLDRGALGPLPPNLLPRSTCKRLEPAP